MPDLYEANSKLDRARSALGAVVDLLDSIPTAADLHLVAHDDLACLLGLVEDELARAGSHLRAD